MEDGWAAYNPAPMLDALSNLLAPAVLERLTLVLNHVLRAEPVAVERLRPHAGRRLSLALAGWPTLLPPMPPTSWCVTPAGLLEWQGLAPGTASGASSTPASVDADADLRITVDASNPAALLARMLIGDRPAVQVEGDAQLAADVGWLLANLRWDVAADLERVFGPVVAHQVHQAGRALARGLRAALDAAGPLAARVAQVSSDLSSRFGGGRR
jgi:ubiquinone biosynthesis protein UbiJ